MRPIIVFHLPQIGICRFPDVRECWEWCSYLHLCSLGKIMMLNCTRACRKRGKGDTHTARVEAVTSAGRLLLRHLFSSWLISVWQRKHRGLHPPPSLHWTKRCGSFPMTQGRPLFSVSHWVYRRCLNFIKLKEGADDSPGRHAIKDIEHLKWKKLLLERGREGKYSSSGSAMPLF